MPLTLVIHEGNDLPTESPEGLLVRESTGEWLVATEMNGQWCTMECDPIRIELVTHWAIVPVVP